MNASEIQTQLDSSYYLGAISFTLLFYDYFLTLGWEISRYWGAKITWPTVLFFLNRYGTLLGNIPVVIQTFWTTPSTPTKTTVCRYLSSYHQYFIIIIQIIVGVMLILRTYALYERNNRVLGFLIVFSAGIICVGVWAIVSSGRPSEDNFNIPLYIGCTYEMARPQSIGMAIAWSAMGLFDCMIFLLTLCRALSQRHLTGLPLITVLIRDGSIYFGVMVISNLANILTFVFGGPYTHGVATTFTNIISSIMISRLVLNLRDPTLSTTTTSTGFSRSGDTYGEGVFSTYLTPSALDGLPLRSRTDIS
ncbi:hypothetical protein DFH09DRAFT_371921 [Mycena vulgaris]|nr:hypothetical protein DFH09DRAFT_371921 [Mycena vulgaris]